MKNKKCPIRSQCWDYKSGNCENCDLGDHITKLHKKIDRLKAKNKKLEARSEWISVDDRLPENDYGKHWKERKYYLVMTEPSGLMRVAKFGSKEHLWWIDSHDTVMTSSNYAKVTHWMPLPEPPKGE